MTATKKHDKPFRVESTKSRLAFEVYRDLGPTRNFDVLMSKLLEMDSPPTKKKRTLFTWSASFRWDERCREWDDQQYLIRAREERKRQQKEHIERLRKFRKAADQASVLSLIASAGQLEKINGLVDQVLSRVKLPEDADLKDLSYVIQASQMAIRNADAAFDLKAKAEGLDRLLNILKAKGDLEARLDDDDLDDESKL